jgi:tetratricopeptide (TPR) repeat protein
MVMTGTIMGMYHHAELKRWSNTVNPQPSSISTQTTPSSGQYSWQTAKNPQSPDVLDALPGVEVFVRLEQRVEALKADTRNGSADYLARLSELAESYEQLGDMAAAEAACARCLEQADTDIGHGRVAFSIDRARLRCRMGDVEAASALLHDELAGAEREAREEDTGKLLTALACVDLAVGQAGTALDRLHRSFGIARASKSVYAKAQALSAVGIAYVHREEPNEALDILDRAALLCQRCGDRESLAKVYNNIGVIRYLRGRFVDAIPRLELGLDLAGARPDLLTLVNALNNNIRAFEMQYLEPASHFRPRLESLLTVDLEPSPGRLSDYTIAPTAPRLTDVNATYASDPLIAEATLFISMRSHSANLPGPEPIPSHADQSATTPASARVS